MGGLQGEARDRCVPQVRGGTSRMRALVDGCGTGAGRGIRFRPRGGAACGVSRIRTRAPRPGPPSRCGSAPELREACQGVTTHGQGSTEVGRSRTPPTEVGGCQRGVDGWKSAEAGAARAWPQQGVPVSSEWSSKLPAPFRSLRRLPGRSWNVGHGPAAEAGHGPAGRCRIGRGPVLGGDPRARGGAAGHGVECLTSGGTTPAHAGSGLPGQWVHRQVHRRGGRF